MDRRRFALVGTGARAQLYTHALAGEFAASCELVGLCDSSRVRREQHSRRLFEAFGITVVCYAPESYEAMITEQRADVVIVCTIDCTHADYVCRALEAGADVIVEKPITTTAEALRHVLAAVARTGRTLRVGFNYRYAPRHSRVRELLIAGTIGKVTSVHFEWLLDTVHGADYFRRWHREKRNSGGLLVHKAAHHFDLVNWWLGSRPESVAAFGRLAFYGREAAAARGDARACAYGRGSDEAARGCPFALDLRRDESLMRLYGGEAELEDGYVRDRSCFAEGVTTEDELSVLVRYESGACLSYHLTAFAPFEGLRVSFTGTRGRIEYEVDEASGVAGADDDHNLPDRPAATAAAAALAAKERVRLTVHEHWSPPRRVEVPGAERCEAGHGGGDARMLRDLLTPGSLEDPLGRAADHEHGAQAVVVGAAANLSLESGAFVQVQDLLAWTGPISTGRWRRLAAAAIAGILIAASITMSSLGRERRPGIR